MNSRVKLENLALQKGIKQPHDLMEKLQNHLLS